MPGWISFVCFAKMWGIRNWVSWTSPTCHWTLEFSKYIMVLFGTAANYVSGLRVAWKNYLLAIIDIFCPLVWLRRTTFGNFRDMPSLIAAWETPQCHALARPSQENPQFEALQPQTKRSFTFKPQTWTERTLNYNAAGRRWLAHLGVPGQSRFVNWLVQMMNRTMLESHPKRKKMNFGYGISFDKRRVLPLWNFIPEICVFWKIKILGMGMEFLLKTSGFTAPKFHTRNLDLFCEVVELGDPHMWI